MDPGWSAPHYMRLTRFLIGILQTRRTATSFLRNPNYHERSDTPDTLDYSRMAKVVRAVHAVAMEF